MIASVARMPYAGSGKAGFRTCGWWVHGDQDADGEAGMRRCSWLSVQDQVLGQAASVFGSTIPCRSQLYGEVLRRNYAQGLSCDQLL